MVESRFSALIPSGKVAVVCHDSGGAEVLSSWVKGYARDFLLVVDGPAKTIFQSKIGLSRETTLGVAVNCCDWILTGSSRE